MIDLNRENGGLGDSCCQTSSAILTVIGRCTESVQILVVLFTRGYWEILHIDIPMCAIQDIVFQRLQKSWEVMLPMMFATPLHTAIETAAMLAMISYHTSDVHHTGTISGYQGEEHL